MDHILMSESIARLNELIKIPELKGMPQLTHTMRNELAIIEVCCPHLYKVVFTLSSGKTMSVFCESDSDAITLIGKFAIDPGVPKAALFHPNDYQKPLRDFGADRQVIPLTVDTAPGADVKISLDGKPIR